MMDGLERIIATGDRADLKVWLRTCSNDEIASNWVKLANCKVQDFGQLCCEEMERRKLIIKRPMCG